MTTCSRTLLPLLVLLGLSVPSAIRADEPKLEIKQGDHICIIGNTLADRMQHDGWLEAYLYLQFPKHDLVIRNLGFSADEVTLSNRLRSMSFGSPDEWLSGSSPVPQPRKLTHNNPVLANRFEHTNTKADVIFAFFGYNESFAGEAGLPQFKKDLQQFITHTLSQKYNGKSAPRLVLFSPIAHENLKSPHLPDGSANNKRLALYTAAMAEVAAENKVLFVDLFKPTQELYNSGQEAHTINGIHLTEEGNRRVAAHIIDALFGAPPRTVPNKTLRQAVRDKNFHWFNRYRTVDGYSVYGDRAFIEYGPERQSNYEVMQRELDILDLMTANRDKRIWSVAQGGDSQVDDTKLPPLMPVITNIPGKLPGGKHEFVDPEAAVQKMVVAKGFKVELFASEKMFPELTKAVQMAFDPQGRLWVAVWPTYPHWKPGDPMDDKLIILEDTDGDGKADKCTVWADGLHCPTGFEFVPGGVLVAQAPDIMLLKDPEGKGKATQRLRVVHGIDSADTHHTSNSFVLDPGGAVYFQEGTFHHTQVETPYGPAERCVNAGVFRYDPRKQKFEVYVTYGFANPHGHVFDHWGQDIVVDGTGSDPYHAALFSSRLEHPNKHNRPPTVYNRWARPCPGMEYISGKHFPEEFHGNLLVADVIQARGILMYKIEDDGASLKGTEIPLGLQRNMLLTSSDPNFRPSDLKIGPDGALYFLDWQNPIIGHLQHNLRDPNRDHEHGRIYRVTTVGRPLDKPVKIAGEPIEKLLDLLKNPEDRVRYRTRIELADRKADDVMPALKKWIETLDKKDPDYEHHLLEALWVHQNQDYQNTDLLKRVLASPDFRARAAATRVLSYWRENLDALDLLLKCAADEHPRVRLEAVRAASYFKRPEAIEVILVAAEKPHDAFVDFVSKEALRTIEPHFQQAVKDKRKISFKTTAGVRYFYKTVSTDELLKLDKNAGVYMEMLFRKGIRDEYRREALTGLAKLENKPELKVLIDALKMQDEAASAQDESVLFDLVRLMTSKPPAEMQEFRGNLEQFATTAKMPVMRQLGYVALIAVDGNVEKAWALAGKSVKSLTDLVNAMPMIRDPGQRANLYPKVEPLLEGLPKELGVPVSKGKTVMGRYVRVEIPGNGKTLTLAEVEVYSDGKNIARGGKASQSTIGYGGEAKRGIDGNKSGSFGDGGQTHTAEGGRNPWWEVDLGSEAPITSIVIYNRTDDGLGQRLNGFTLKVLNKDRQVVFQQVNIPAPAVKAEFEVGTDAPDRLVRRAAMGALVTVRGQEEAAFKALAKFVKDSPDRDMAIASILRIPTNHWPKPEANALLDVVLGYIRKLPPAERTSPVAVDAMQLGDNLAALLPIDEARKVRKELGELSIRVLRVGTLPEQMAYDKDRLVVQAGKPFEILLDNADLMPHNFVITEPGAMADIGQQAEADATKPGAADRHYVPISSKVLLSSRLIQPRESQRLAWIAPKTPGIYPYVCTYPGHWRRMYGALYVVDDLESYQSDAEAYLAKHPLPIKDDLLKFNRPRKEWKFEDLSGEVTKLEGRSFANGRQLFKVAACISCHKIGGEGHDFGQDLTKLDMKIDNPTEILRHVLEPSLKIDDKYRVWKIETTGGKTVIGMILEETKQAVKIIENPLAKADAVTIKVEDIDKRTRSDVSLMPKGLLDKFTKEEILDIIAYVASKANPQHKYFQPAHDHHH
jgi:putative heme-binding domain-containing protein